MSKKVEHSSVAMQSDNAKRESLWSYLGAKTILHKTLSILQIAFLVKRKTKRKRYPTEKEALEKAPESEKKKLKL